MRYYLDSSRSLRLFILAILPGIGAFARPALADDPTVYKIHNRWLSTEYLAAGNGKVIYSAGDDANFHWTLQDVHGLARIENLGTHEYMIVAPGSTDVTLAKTAPADVSGLWDITVGVAPWSSIKNQGNGKFLNCEHKLGYVQCDSDKVPNGDDFWSGQWELVYVSGPKPARHFKNHEIAVVSPAYCADVQGDVKIEFIAPGFSKATAKCWKQGDGMGTDSTVADVALNDKGEGSFVFPGEKYPHGPVVVRISAEDGATKDNCYLQLYNKGGVSWNEGLPKDPPPAAKGLTLLFADDFTGPLSISSTDPKATYFDHKPLGGDFSTLQFTGHDEPKNPFLQVDTYLRIRADAKKKSSGLISSLNNDGKGIKASAPCYFECRFLGPNAIGTWPAFWLMTDYPTARKAQHLKDSPSDELDIIEAYGGEGPHHPNAFDKYMITPHAWDQGAAGKAAESKAFADMHNPISMNKAGISSTWYETFHTYGCLVTDTETIYYCDNIEVGRHKTLDLSKKQPLFFMINLATGGGWPVDLSRYDGVADMYVDYVRVFEGKR
ncbi:MAG TPA: hypothetical protein VFE47_30185 [Tepidisphaeraceae bacterium]|nr:hypothetical protein [Tepidisphaeraceae bacterium]